MSRFHLLLSAFCAILAYVCVSLLGGQEGLWAYSQFQSHKILLVQNVDYLQQVNEQLAIDFNALEHDTDVQAAYARKMGFIQEGEKLIKVSGIPDNLVIVYNAGTKTLRPEVLYIPEWIAKGIGFFVFICYNLIYSLLYLKRSLCANDTVKV